MVNQSRRNGIYLLLIASLLVGLFTGRAFFFTMAYLFAILLFLSFLWAWFAVRHITISRRTRTRRAQVGKKLDEQFTVYNTSIIPKLWLEVRDHSDLPGHRASHVVPAMGARSRYHWRVETQCLVRGEFRLGPISLISGDPFGFYLTPRWISATSRVIVYPATVPITKFDLPMGTLSGGEAQRQRSHHVTTNAAGVRDYAYGDSFNRIHWKTSARRDKLIVKEFEIDPLVDIWVFADFSAVSLTDAPNLQRLGDIGLALPSGAPIPPSTEEYVVITAASIAQHFINLERAVGFAAYTPNREAHQPERGNRQMTEIFESLSVARSTSPYTLAQMLSLEAAHFTRGTTLIIVTASIDHKWISEAEILSRRGIRPMCILIDPTSFNPGVPTAISLDEMRGRLQLAKIPTIIIRKDDDLTLALSQRAL